MKKSEKLNPEKRKNTNKLVSIIIMVILVILTIIVILPIFYNTEKGDE